jgi:hypothetical protein
MEIGLFVIFSLVVYFLYLNLPESYRLIRRSRIMILGIEAEATILFIASEHDEYFHKLPKIQIRVEPVRGRNFVTELKDIPKLLADTIKVGDKVLVKFLVKNPREVVFLKHLPIV